MNPLYLRREPALDPALLHYVPKGRKWDVVAYRDPDAKDFYTRWMWYHESKPTRRNKRVTINCVTRPVIWLPDLS